MNIEFMGNSPNISKNAFCAPNAAIIGSAEISDDASIWFGACIRADNNKIFIGKGTNIQDLTIIHVDDDTPVHIGENVTVGHSCIIHGANIEDNVLVGMGSLIMDRAKVGRDTIIGAGSLIPSGKEIPSGVLVMGRPAKVVRELTQEEILSITKSAVDYAANSKKYIL
ncbi:gamma carbonic anhydrase family protein [Proteocatella sphenisci]|uniref:gamma carbonic anhydrase family protein n=1 Tax=Proteocatella sphenisci TaxID=181070 RepID=UPI00048B3A83|nr:gamma carbonic anhydrase family protein [Proteocatella sphenisci]